MSNRVEKYSEQLRDILASCFTGDQLRDPRVRDVTVTHVRVTPDLQLATVYFRLYGESPEPEKAAEGLESCKGFLKKALAKELKVRRIPELRFFYDDSVENGSRIEALLNSLKQD